jgi:hypothetical protein
VGARDGDIVGICESEQAITLVQERNRELLKSLSRERPDLYRQLGEAVVARVEALRQRSGRSAKRGSSPKKPAKRAATLTGEIAVTAQDVVMPVKKVVSASDKQEQAKEQTHAVLEGSTPERESEDA